MWLMGIKPRSSGQPSLALIHQLISPSPRRLYFFVILGLKVSAVCVFGSNTGTQSYLLIAQTLPQGKVKCPCPWFPTSSLLTFIRSHCYVLLNGLHWVQGLLMVPIILRELTMPMWCLPCLPEGIAIRATRGGIPFFFSWSQHRA